MRIFIGVLLLLVCDIIFAQTSKYFIKAYGGAGVDEAWSSVETLEGNYMVAGASTSFGAGQVQTYLLKIRPDGDSMWSRVYGNPYYTWTPSIKATADSNYIIGGTIATASGDYDFYLAKIDTGGTIIWDKTYGDTLDNAAYEAQQTSDGGYVITGWSYDTNSVAQIHLIKTDASGNLMWEKKYGAVNHYESFAVQQTTDKGYIIGGEKLIGVLNFDGYVLKVDSLGNFQWDYIFGGIEDDAADDVIQTLDGGYIIASSINSSSKIEPYLLKLDANGNKQWDKTFYRTSGIGVFISVKQLSDSNFIVVGTQVLPSTSTADGIIIKTDAAGDSIWGRVYGGAMNDYFYDVQLTSDSGFIACGRTESFGAGGADAWLVKMNCLGFAGPPVADFTYTPSGDTAFFINQSDSAGNYLWNFGDGDTSAVVNPVHAYPDTGSYSVILIASACGESDTLTKTVNITSVGIERPFAFAQGDVVIYPNPFSDVATISISHAEFSSASQGFRNKFGMTFTMYDLLGREVYHSALRSPQSTISRGNLPSGMYFYKLTDKGKVLAVGKIVIQ